MLTPLLALALFRTPVPRPSWAGVVLSVVGLLLLNGVPGGSAAGNALVLGNALAQALQIAAMERFAPRYDARALTFLQMAVACLGFSAIAASLGRVSVPDEGSVWYALLVTGVFAGRARVPRRDVGAVADDGRARCARLHARGAVRRALRRPAPLPSGSAGSAGRAAR